MKIFLRRDWQTFFFSYFYTLFCVPKGWHFGEVESCYCSNLLKLLLLAESFSYFRLFILPSPRCRCAFVSINLHCFSERLQINERSMYEVRRGLDQRLRSIVYRSHEAFPSTQSSFPQALDVATTTRGIFDLFLYANWWHEKMVQFSVLNSWVETNNNP